ncbi:MAG: type II secretion system minor pseudopilin GspK, partial [Brevundimonas sp.]
MRRSLSLGTREGMALLTVLLLVAVMAAVCVLILDDVRFTVRRTSNVEHLAEMQAHAAVAETVAAKQVMRLSKANPQMTPIMPVWNGQAINVDTDIGQVRTIV